MYSIYPTKLNAWVLNSSSLQNFRYLEAGVFRDHVSVTRVEIPGCLDSDIPIHNEVETMFQVRIITIKCNCSMFNAERRQNQRLTCTLYVLTSKGLFFPFKNARYLM